MNLFQKLADACHVEYADAKRMFYATMYSRTFGQHNSHVVDWLIKVAGAKQ